MGWRVISITAPIVIIESGAPNTGLFEYSGTPALGNPPIAYAAAPGVTHDPFGNTLPASGGFVSRTAIGFSQLLSGGLLLSLVGSVASAQVAALTLSGSSSGQAATLTSGIGPEVGGSASQLVIGDSGAGGAGVDITAATGIALFGLRVSGDTFDRLSVSSAALLSWGTGSGATDTTLGRTAAGVITIGSTIIVGIVLTNLLQLTEQAVPAATTSVQVVGNASGHAEVVSDTTHGDGNSYDVERLTLRLTSIFTINNTIAQTIFSKHLGIGTYEVEVWMVTQNTTAADAAVFAFSFSGTATGLVDFTSMTTGTAVVGYGASSTITTTFNGQGVGGNQQVRMNLTITVTVAGTLGLNGAELVAGNTVTISAGSRMRICPVVAT